MVLALPRGHALAGGNRDTPIPLKALADQTFIIYGEPHGQGIHAVAFGRSRRRASIHQSASRYPTSHRRSISLPSAWVCPSCRRR